MDEEGQEYPDLATPASIAGDFRFPQYTGESNPPTPGATPGIFNSEGKVTEEGHPVATRLMKGVHWNENSYPAWTQAERRDETPLTVNHRANHPTAVSEKPPPPITIERIAAILDSVRGVLGFQFHSEVNVFELLMSQLDSHASRSDPEVALRSLHADYVGGPRANYRKWYFASGMDILDRAELRSRQAEMPPREGKSGFKLANKLEDPYTGEFNDSVMNVDINGDESVTPHTVETKDVSEDEPTLATAIKSHTFAMETLCHEDRLVDLAVYMMCWGEANQIRFMPECLAFIYKCALDFYSANTETRLPELYFLDNVITPLYKCYRDKNYVNVEGVWVKGERDHQNTIGYDDMNQQFWYTAGLASISSAAGQPLLELPKAERYEMIGKVDWSKVFHKTYREARTWLHAVTNFSRIWIIHGSIFWFYTAFNSPTLYTPEYVYTKNNPPQVHIQWSIIALGGALGPFISIIALLAEMWFVPRRYAGAEPVFRRILMLLIMLLIIVAPSVYTLFWTSWIDKDVPGIVMAIFQFILAVGYTLYFSIVPLADVACFGQKQHERRFLANKYFIGDFQKLAPNDKSISWMMAFLVFGAKFTESYFFLTLSLRDPIRELSVLDLSDKCVGDIVLGSILCKLFPAILLGGLFVTDMVLFFLDTYLWYVIFNTLISVVISFYGGASIWTPWRNIYSRLPQRMGSKLLTQSTDSALMPLWNAVIETMRRSNLVTLEQMRKLTYTSRRAVVATGELNKIVEPAFFTSEEDRSLETSIFTSDCEAHRRIAFFAQSLATPLPEPVPIHEMPSFTVLIPHYSEKIFLTLRETIKPDNEHSRVTVLEYLQRLYPTEWSYFVQESRELTEEDQIRQRQSRHIDPHTLGSEKLNSSATSTTRASTLNAHPAGTAPTQRSSDSELPYTLVNMNLKSENFNIPFDTLGFATSRTCDTNRTRIWGSSHTQTLYRTINGFMQYAYAIKILHFAENEAFRNNYKQNAASERVVDSLVDRKFNMLVAMQKYASFNQQQLDDVFQLLQTFPGLRIAYVEKEQVEGEDEPRYYSSLLEGRNHAGGKLQPRLRIRISGDPILGDGKSDNQNHSLIFYRGEYIQLVDSNQDHYVEECLKIRNLLVEFDEMAIPSNPYNIDESHRQPVVIVGAREYIFSENVGVLGDVAAGKEQTFGTLFARTLAKIGGKLHYGHPDVLNAIFMTTRGGVSKAQKGLHLNEDIYAGMSALMRGGRIKHTEYIQCGKGRDLGFVSILNFTAKIGAGMGEQMLSREYFYLGTRLPIDRFLSFYYAHPGFHLNNVFIMVSLDLFLLCILWIASIGATSTVCKFDRNAPATDPHRPEGCRPILPLVDWIRRCVVSIFVVFFISLLPLLVQELAEKGLWRSLTRIGRHFASLSMLFEIFVCRIYAFTFTSDLSVGGAKYIATGRGFATARAHFHVLYRGYAPQSIYFGARALMILLYVTIVFWHPSLLWFWVTTVALMLSPTIFNPHQFSRTEFFLDYRRLMQWFARADSEDSWQCYVRDTRVKLTGYKKRDSHHSDVSRPHFLKLVTSKIVGSLCLFAVMGMPYVYLGSQRVGRYQRTPSASPLLRAGICAAGPMLVDAVVLLAGAFISLILGLTLCKADRASHRASAVIALYVRLIAVIVQFGFFWLMYVLEQGAFATTLLGCVVAGCMQKVLCSMMTVMLLGRQRIEMEASSPWWSGRWRSAHLGWHYLTAPLAEWMAKIVECPQFVCDFLLCHLLLAVQTPLLLVPYIDKMHSLLLLWLSPSRDTPVPLHYQRQQRQLTRKYFVLYVVVQATLIGLFVAPTVIPGFVRLGDHIDILPGLKA